MQRLQRKFEAQGDRWIARRQGPPEGTLYDQALHRKRGLEPGIWFQSAAGRTRFLRHVESEGFPSETEFLTMSGLQLTRLLERAVRK